VVWLGFRHKKGNIKHQEKNSTNVTKHDPASWMVLYAFMTTSPAEHKAAGGGASKGLAIYEVNLYVQNL
jgi:hypothetical protein